jgi:fructokinase
MVRIGVDLGGTKIEAAAFDPGNRELSRRRVPTPRDDYAATVEAVARLVLDLEDGAGTAHVGVGTPGAISPATGRIKNANSTWLNGRPLREDLEARLARPVRLANDANCFALSEAVDGAGADAGVVFGVILGTGVGGGIVVGQRLLLGANAVAGEWGHNPLPWPRDDERPGPACYCGRRGCIETFLSGPGLAEDHAARTGARLPSEAIVRAAESGEPAARATLDRYVDRAARGLAAVVNVLDPDVIVLGGGLSRAPLLYAEIPARWGAYVFSDRVDTRLRPPVHGDAGGVRGAAWLWETGG